MENNYHDLIGIFDEKSLSIIMITNNNNKKRKRCCERIMTRMKGNATERKY